MSPNTENSEQNPGTDGSQKDQELLERNQKRISSIWTNIREFLSDLLNIQKESDHQETMEAVRRDISFKGHNAWILIFSIMVASIGLNVSSPAVVIGAMLISPLMGPIVGIGLGVAVNDPVMLKRSLINLGVMVGLSLLTATLYFLLSPLAEYTEELKARTYPTILDVLVAIFGGLALIVAKAKKGTIVSVILGVAIATALMPPLCTAGYGFSVWDPEIFGGALYLFTINAIFIGLSTFVVAKVLRFPMVKYANQAKRKRVLRIATVVGLIVVIPSIILFVNMLREQLFINEVNRFIQENVKYQGMAVSKIEQDYSQKKVGVFLVGQTVPDEVLQTWTDRFNENANLEGAKLQMFQGSRPEMQDPSQLQEAYIDNLKVVASKEERILQLQEQVKEIQQRQGDFSRISQEAKLNYPSLGGMSFARSVNRDFKNNKLDTVMVFTVSWADSTLSRKQELEQEKRLSDWLSYRLGGKDSILVRQEAEKKVSDRETKPPRETKKPPVRK